MSQPPEHMRDAFEPASARLKEIRDVLLEARQSTDYDIGSPAALDHLLRHVVALIDTLLQSLTGEETK